MQAKKIYDISEGNYLTIPLHEKALKHPKRERKCIYKLDIENDLMNYYDVVHSFFLVEYQMDEFNPKDGQTIFDCGAVRGMDCVLFVRFL